MNCPTCKSVNSQTVKMAVMAGTTSGTSTVVGINTNLDIGAALIGSKSQTNLADSLNPGKRPTPPPRLSTLGELLINFSYVVTIISIYCIFTKNIQASGASFLLMAFMYVVGKVLIKTVPDTTEIDNWEKKNKLFETGWICHKCGHTWTP